MPIDPFLIAVFFRMELEPDRGPFPDSRFRSGFLVEVEVEVQHAAGAKQVAVAGRIRHGILARRDRTDPIAFGGMTFDGGSVHAARDVMNGAAVRLVLDCGQPTRLG